MPSGETRIARVSSTCHRGTLNTVPRLLFVFVVRYVSSHRRRKQFSMRAKLITAVEDTLRFSVVLEIRLLCEKHAAH